jgi:hypothetical protein
VTADGDFGARLLPDAIVSREWLHLGALTHPLDVWVNFRFYPAEAVLQAAILGYDNADCVSVFAVRL